jgi:ribonuclease Z
MSRQRRSAATPRTAGPPSIETLVNGSTGDPALYLDFPGAGNALLFDAGTLHRLPTGQLADLAAVFLTHFHIDHFGDFDRILRATTDCDRTIRIVGPTGTRERIAARLASYAYNIFPFMKLEFEVLEIDAGGGATWSRHRAQDGFAASETTDRRPRKLRGGICYDSRECRVRAVAADHTVPCLAYAVEMRRAWVFDREKSAGQPLRPGPWVSEVIAALNLPTADRPQTLAIGGADFPLADLRRNYFSRTPAGRLAFVTDTRFSDESRERLIDLAAGAKRLYCDAYYLPEQADKAQEHGHMTALQSGELAAAAGVDSLILMHLGGKAARRPDEALAAARTHFPQTSLAVTALP